MSGLRVDPGWPRKAGRVVIRRADHGGWNTPTVGTAIRIGIASLAFGAAAVHFGVISDHFREYWVFGVFFVAVTALQVIWGALVLVRPSSRVFSLGALGMSLLVLTWGASRTVGAPFGPSAGSPEAVGLLDSVATGLEVLAVIGALILLRTRLGARSLSAVATALASGAAGLAVALATIAAFVGTSGGEESTGEEVARTGGALFRTHLVHFVLVVGSLIFMAIYAFVTRPKDRTRSGAVPAIDPLPATGVSNPRTPAEVAGR